jgi:hypothetical protein
VTNIELAAFAAVDTCHDFTSTDLDWLRDEHTYAVARGIVHADSWPMYEAIARRELQVRAQRAHLAAGILRGR